MANRNSFKSGSCEMIALHILNQYGDCYGYQLSNLIRSLSDNNFFFPEGSLYPALHKMIDNGLISSYSHKAGLRRVQIIYHIEKKGKEKLEQLLREYRETTSYINAILENDFSQFKTE